MSEIDHDSQNWRCTIDSYKPIPTEWSWCMFGGCPTSLEFLWTVCLLESFLELVTVTLCLTALFIEFFNNKKEFIDLFQLIFKLWYYICTCMNILNLLPLTNKLLSDVCLQVFPVREREKEGGEERLWLLNFKHR